MAMLNCVIFKLLLFGTNSSTNLPRMTNPSMTLADVGARSGQKRKTGLMMYSAEARDASATERGRPMNSCAQRNTNPARSPKASRIYVYVPPDFCMRVPWLKKTLHQ